MREIAQLLEQRLVTAQELKDFLASICCERYENLEQFDNERASLEKSYPTYSEAQECGTDVRWGDFKLGRLPAFLYEDLSSRSQYVEDSNQMSQSPVMSQAEDYGDAAQYRTTFGRAFQYFQSRCQHHTHKMVNGKRIVPNACRSKCKPNQCKHEAPWSGLSFMDDYTSAGVQRHRAKIQSSLQWCTKLAWSDTSTSQ